MPFGGGFAGGVGHVSFSGGKWSDDDDSRKSICSCIAGLLSAIILLVGFIIFGIEYYEQKPIPSFYSPGDTRLVSYSSFFCAGVTLKDNSSRTGASLYLITETPALNDCNNFTINSTMALKDNEYYFWNYYLYPNSNFSSEVCSPPPGADGKLYIVKGTANFSAWISSPSSDFAVAVFSIGTALCSTIVQQYTYHVIEEDEYYFVYYNLPGNNIILQLNVTVSFERFEYSTADLASQANCSITSAGKCSVVVPYGSSYSALIVTDIPENVDWGENVDVTWSCANRGWAYAVVILVPIATIVGFVTLCIIVLCCRCRRRSYSYEALS